MSALCDAIEATASSSPERVAVADSGETRTYGELAELLRQTSDHEHGERRAQRVSASVSDVEMVLAGACRGESLLALDASATAWELERAGSLFVDEVPADLADQPGPVLGLCTSGSSGLPKVVELDWESLLANATSFARAAAYGPADVLWCTTPLAHLYCLGAGVLGGLLSGSTILLGKGMLTPVEFERLAVAEQPTVLLSVPFLFRRYLQMLREAPEIVPRLRLRSCIAAGEPVPPELVGAWREAAGVSLLAHYGLTEGGQITLAAGSTAEGVGRPLEDVEVQIGGDGQVLVRRRPPARPYRVIGQEADPDGWYATGDLGHLDERGNLHVGGRADSRINIAGKKVDPVEVEEALGACEGVVDCAVASVEGPDGTQVVAFICLDESGALGDGEIRARLADRLSPHKLPRRFAQVAEIPRTLTGKVRRGELIAGLSSADDDGAVPAPETEDGTGAAESSLARRLARLPEGERDAEVLELVREHAASVALGHPSGASIDPGRSFKNAGFDSLLAVELRNRLIHATGLHLPETVVFDYPSPRALSGFLLSQAGGPSPGDSSIATELDRIERLLASVEGEEREQAIARLQLLLATVSAPGDADDPDVHGDADLNSASDDELIELIDAEFGSA
ncbi:MAG TPA: AMP-binding protein [Solirubrobacterales bacterium]|nr:AMP-binding protein [Solirubrobacterales bacterium]